MLIDRVEVRSYIEFCVELVFLAVLVNRLLKSPIGGSRAGFMSTLKIVAKRGSARPNLRLSQVVPILKNNPIEEKLRDGVKLRCSARM